MTFRSRVDIASKYFAPQWTEKLLRNPLIQQPHTVMASILPPIPRFMFTVFEPLSLIAGWLSPTFSTEYFVRSQIPSVTTAFTTTTWPTTRVLALQLGNVYGLLGLLGVGVLYQTTEPKVVRNFLLACAIGDVGHLYVTYMVMEGPFWDIGRWNVMAWGNIGVTLMLLITRCLYLMGYLGKDKVESSDRQRKKI